MRLKKLLTTTLIVSISASSMLAPIKATATTVDTVSTATESTDSNIDTVTPTATPAPTATPTVTPTPKATKATYPTTFKDIKKGSTYYTAVTYLAKKGAIGGYADGNFKAKTNITNAKFVGMLMRAINPKLSRATKGSDYTAAIMKEGAKLGIYKSSELTAENYNSALTRKNMVLWVSRALEYMDEDVKVLMNVENLMTDYESISDTKYQTAAKEVYSAGIVTSKTFSQNNKVTRGTAVTVIYKLANTKARTNMSKVAIPTDNEAGQDATAVTIKATGKNRGLAHIGDTWVAKSGTKTKLTGITWAKTEVPGYGQGIDLYTGLVYGDSTLKNGDTGDIWNGDSTYMAEPFTVAKDSVNKKTFAYFRTQWVAIKSYESNKSDSIKSPKNGQMCGYFTQYNKSLDMWIWIGPSI